MATVTAFTAERMLVIENTSIVDGNIVGDNLILKRRDLVTIDAGNVRGLTGSPGVTTEELSVLMIQLQLAIEAACPAATVRMTMNTVADIGWLMLNGQTIIDAEGLYPVMWPKIPATYKSGSNFVTPNMTQIFPIAGTPGTSGGSNTKIINQGNLPAATITIDPPNLVISIDPPSTQVYVDPPNTAVTINDPGHKHNLLMSSSGSGQSVIADAYSDGQWYGNDIALSTTGITANVDIAPFWASVDITSFNTNVNIPPFQSNFLGSGTPLDVIPAWVAFSFQIKAH